MSEYEAVEVDGDEASEYWAKRALEEYEVMSGFSNACNRRDKNDVKEFHRMNRNLLKKYNIAFAQLRNVKSLTETQWKEFRKNGLEKILNKLYERYESDDNEVVFLAAAKFDLAKLTEIHTRYLDDKKYFNRIRNTDSLVLFALKYGDVTSVHFVASMEILIEGMEVDTKKFDVNGKSALHHIFDLYKQHQNEPTVLDNLTTVAELIIHKGVYETDQDTQNFFQNNDLDLGQHQERMDTRTQLFYWIATNAPQQFCNCQINKKMANFDNGEHTLLQFAIIKISKKNDIINIVQFLLRSGADPNKTTKEDQRSPLELAVLNNSIKVFEELLQNTKTKIGRSQFSDIVTNILTTPRIPVRMKMFQLLLEWDKLDVTFTHDKTGNTSLHFAVILSHQKATESLLKGGSSLVVQNKRGKSVLDMISPEDLEKFFDSCLVLKSVKSNIMDICYKVQLNFFGSLIDKEQFDEFYVVSKLSKNKNLRHLLKHPLVYTFINLKWSKMKVYFWVVLVLQLLLLLSLSCRFLALWAGVLVGLPNAIIKVTIFLHFCVESDSVVFPALAQAPIHASMEIALITIYFLGFLLDRVHAFLFILMAICFLITAGYHPILSKWSIMLQTVFKTFTLLLLFFSTIIFAFSLGFYVLFVDDSGETHLFRNVSTSFFKAYIMTAGELSLDNVKFDTSGFSGYLFLVLFTLCVPLVIVNFWTAVAVTDVEKIEREAEVNAIENVVVFMRLVEHVYDGARSVRRTCRALLCPSEAVRDPSHAVHDSSDAVHDSSDAVYDFSDAVHEGGSRLLRAASDALKGCASKCAKFFGHLTDKPYLFLADDRRKYYDVNKCKVISYIDSREQQAQLDRSEKVTEIDNDCLNKIKFHVLSRKESA